MRTAAAEILFEPLDNLFARGMRIALQQGVRGQDHSGGAVAALESAVIDESPLQRVKRVTLCEPLDRQDALARHIRKTRAARTHGGAVDEHGAGAADAFAATELRSRDAGIRAQRPQKRAAFARLERN